MSRTMPDAASGQDTSLEKADKTGYLHTYSSKTFLGREKWKKRYYVLTANKLYRFVKKEDASLDLRSASRRRLINLDTYDICQPANEGESKRDHVFILDGANSSIEQTKYVFAADTKEDMQEWITRLRKAILSGGPRGSGRPQRPPRTKVSSLHITPSSKSDGDASSEPPTPVRLYNPTKYRVRGPRGRRLPQKKNRLLRDANDKYISNSLCELDGSLSDEDCAPKSSLVRRSGVNSPPLGDRAKSNSSGNLAYQYSSSDDSLLWKDSTKITDKTNARDNGQIVVDVQNIDKNDKNEKIISVDANEKAANEGHKITTKNNLVHEDLSHVDLTNRSSNEQKKVPSRKDVRAPPAPTKPGIEAADLEAGPRREHPPKQGAVGPLIYLSAKLLELSGCLDRFQRHTKEELAAMKTHLVDMAKLLVEDPPGWTQVDILERKACVIMTDLKSTEEELKILMNATENIQKSLQKMKDNCDEMLKTI